MNAPIKYQTYLFFRKHEGFDYFYPVQLRNDDDVLPNVECNPGTVKVTTEDGRVVWSLQ